MSALDVLQAAQLGFELPQGPELQYNTSEAVNVTWRSPYDYTTVEVWQGPFRNGAYSTDLLVANATQDQNSLFWDATSLSGADLDVPFFFRLQKGDAPNTCELCTTDSAAFRVSDPAAVFPSSSSSTSTATSTASSTASITPSAAAATTSTSAAAVSSGQSDNSALGIGLGVGLGIGLGLILFLIAIGLILLKRRRKRQEAQARRAEALKAELAARDSLASGWTSKYSAKTMSGMSTSGMSYHSRFEFETPDGSIREGWERLFGPDGQVTYHRMPTRPGQVVIRR